MERIADVGPLALPSRRSLILVGLVALLGLGLGVVAALIALSPSGLDASPASPDGAGALGAGPGIGLLASAPVVPSNAGGATAAGAVAPSSTPTGFPPVTGGPIIVGPTLFAPGTPDPLVVSYVAKSDLASQTITVTVTNPAKVDQSWNNVALGIQGVTLIVTTPDPNVTYKQVGWAHCFFAGSRVATVAGGESVTFTANVVGLLGRTASIGLDVPACG